MKNYNAAYVWSICLVAALGGLLFGYDWVVISGANIFYEKYFNLTSSFDVGWAKSCALVGCLLGAVISGALSDRFGRKRLLLLAAILFTISALGTGMAGTYLVFVIWRIIGGMAIGLASNLSPMYIAEVSPAEIRGKLVSLNQFTIVCGIVLAQFTNWRIARPVPQGATWVEILNSWNGQLGWRWMFAATAVPAIVFVLGVLFVPESPRWLVKKGRPQKAEAVLVRLGGSAYAASALADIEATVVNEIERVNFGDLFEPKMARVLVLGVVLAVLQQWCGINVIFYYSDRLFADAGYKVSDILMNIVIIGVTNLVFTVVAMLTVDHLGRRRLFLFGLAGLALIFSVLGWSLFCKVQGVQIVALVVASIACYACTLAPVTWVILSEIFPNRIRGAAMSVAVVGLWAACFTLTLSFPFLEKSFGPAPTFWLYASICVLGFLFCLAKLPETKGKTLEQIERELVD